MIAWIDLRHYGLRIDALGDGRTVMRGALAHVEAANRLGYEDDGGGNWIRQDGLPDFTSAIREFPDLEVFETAATIVTFALDIAFDPIAARRHFDESRSMHADIQLLPMMAETGIDPRRLEQWLDSVAMPDEYATKMLQAAGMLMTALGPARCMELLTGLDGDGRYATAPRRVVDEFIQAAHDRRYANSHLMEYAIIQMKEMLLHDATGAPYPNPLITRAVCNRALGDLRDSWKADRFHVDQKSNSHKLIKVFGMGKFLADVVDARKAAKSYRTSRQLADLSDSVIQHLRDAVNYSATRNVFVEKYRMMSGGSRPADTMLPVAASR